MQRNNLFLFRTPLFKPNASDHLPAGAPPKVIHWVHKLPGVGQVHCVVRLLALHAVHKERVWATLTDTCFAQSLSSYVSLASKASQGTVRTATRGI